MAKKILITGSSGLIGSEIALLYDRAGYRVFGVDNNSRKRFFGPDGDTRWNLARLNAKATRFTHVDMDIRDTACVEQLVSEVRPDCVIHCAAQPAHEYARRHPGVDFHVNVAGTMNLLEACRMHAPGAVFVFCSSSKVYGPVNEIPFVELPTRFDIDGVGADCGAGFPACEERQPGKAAPRNDRQDARPTKTRIAWANTLVGAAVPRIESGAGSGGPLKDNGRAETPAPTMAGMTGSAHQRLHPEMPIPPRTTPLTGWSFSGITEEFPIEPGDGRGVYGTGKAAADLLVQQYGITYGMPTVCLRGNCMTGPAHSSAELHGFLAYLARCLVQGREYTVIGYGGKQVRDNIHSYDYATAIFALCASPPAPGTVYNIGGGRRNSVSILEAISLMEQISGKRLKTAFADRPREGDHRVYISDMAKFRTDYPEWKLKWSIEEICEDLIRGMTGSSLALTCNGRAGTPAPTIFENHRQSLPRTRSGDAGATVGADCRPPENDDRQSRGTRDCPTKTYPPAKSVVGAGVSAGPPWNNNGCTEDGMGGAARPFPENHRLL